jgi:glycosyltransferase involved in cell wall biosynthesis
MEGKPAPPAQLRVLFVVLEMDHGGLQRVVNLLIRNLNLAVFSPYLCCLDRGGVFSADLDPERVKMFVLGRRPGPFDFRLFRRLCALIRQEQIDIIHSQNGCTLYAALAAMVTRRKIVHTDHGRLIPDKRTAILEDRLCSRIIDRFIGVSEELTEYLAAKVGVKRRILGTIINGVDTDRFHPFLPDRRAAGRRKLGFGDDEMVLGAVCRLDAVKGLDFMIRGLELVRRTQPCCRLVIVGEGPMRAELEAQVAAMNLATSVTFLGWQSDVENILPLLDAYVSTSLSEGTSMTILEAMSCGLPVIASDVGGNGRLVNEANGCLYPVHELEAFASGCLKVIASASARASLGAESRRKADSDFSLQRCVRQYESLYLSVVGGG